jgi:hypothetical protein
VTRTNARRVVVIVRGKSQNDNRPWIDLAPEANPTNPSRALPAKIIATAMRSCLPTLPQRARLLRPRADRISSPKGAKSAEMMKKTPASANPGSPAVISVSLLVDE